MHFKMKLLVATLFAIVVKVIIITVTQQNLKDSKIMQNGKHSEINFLDIVIKKLSILEGDW